MRVIGRIRLDEKGPAEGQCIAGQQQFIYSTLIPCTSPSTSVMYQAHFRESSLLTWTGGMVWKPETQDVAAQPQPSSLHCILRVDEVCRMLNLPGSHRGILQTWENWIGMGIPGRRVKGGGHHIQRDSCGGPQPKTFSTPGAGQTSLEPKRMCALLALPT